MPKGPVSAVVAYFLAFAGGLAATWWLLGQVVTTAFQGPDTDLPLWTLALPLAGLAVFQLVFGALTGLWRGPMFWVWAVGVTYALGSVLAWLASLGWLGAIEAMAAFVGILGGIGLWRASVSDAARKAGGAK